MPTKSIDQADELLGEVWEKVLAVLGAFDEDVQEGRLDPDDVVLVVRQWRALMLIFRMPSTSTSERFTAACEFYRYNPWASKALRDKPYKEYLQTPYWLILREHIKETRGHRCELCATTRPLHVHHKTYEHRGYEFDHLEDLIVLCQNCHAKFHDKLGSR